MKHLVMLIMFTIVLSACGGSAAPTPTSTASLTATLTLEPTKTLASINTPKPTATLNGSPTLNHISSLVAALDIKDVEIMDVRYEDGSRGARSILHIEAKYTATPFDSSAVGDIVGIVAALTTQKGNFESGLFGLNIIMRDANLNSRQVVAVKWQDIVDYGAGRITPEQLFTRLIISP